LEIGDAPVQAFFEGMKPMPTSTHAAHDVRPYTNTRGKYVMPWQQYRSTFLAHPRRRMVREGDDGGEGEPSVAMVTSASRGLACGADGVVANGSPVEVQETSDVAQGASRRWRVLEKGKDAEDGSGVAQAVSGRTKQHSTSHGRASDTGRRVRNSVQRDTNADALERKRTRDHGAIQSG
jgi:hypothetical protein